MNNKKSKYFIIYFLLIATVLSLSGCKEDDDNMNNYNKELLSLSQQNNMKEYKENEIIDKIMDVYITNNDFVLMSRALYIKDISEFLTIKNVKKYEEGFIITFPTEKRKFIIEVDNSGRVRHMINYTGRLPKSEEFTKIIIGMTADKLLELFPNTFLCKNAPAILSETPTKINPIGCEIIFSNGKIGAIELDRQKGTFIVSRTYFSPNEIDKSLLTQINSQ